MVFPEHVCKLFRREQHVNKGSSERLCFPRTRAGRANARSRGLTLPSDPGRLGAPPLPCDGNGAPYLSAGTFVQTDQVTKLPRLVSTNETLGKCFLLAFK